MVMTKPDEGCQGDRPPLRTLLQLEGQTEQELMKKMFQTQTKQNNNIRNSQMIPDSSLLIIQEKGNCSCRCKLCQFHSQGSSWQ